MPLQNFSNYQVQMLNLPKMPTYTKVTYKNDKNAIMPKVTRLNEFSPLGRCFTLHWEILSQNIGHPDRTNSKNVELP
jgi:hypothetical protein